MAVNRNLRKVALQTENYERSWLLNKHFCGFWRSIFMMWCDASDVFAGLPDCSYLAKTIWCHVFFVSDVWCIKLIFPRRYKIFLKLLQQLHETETRAEHRSPVRLKWSTDLPELFRFNLKSRHYDRFYSVPVPLVHPGCKDDMRHQSYEAETWRSAASVFPFHWILDRLRLVFMNSDWKLWNSVITSTERFQ